ncbi:unnamed protein product [Rhizoctonia solani]|uniref:Uncharacterized protein n=1 Tax=Rhizoctonia solani TaxID=456999 RepID=A0A8H3GR21_9AGAM|nr:unnamed protein product [Rhizoctonia solani]
MPPRTRSASRSVHDSVESHLVNIQTDSSAEIDTENLTGLYDYPPDDPRSREYVSGRRRSISANPQYMGSAVDANGSVQTKPAQGVKQREHALQNPLETVSTAVDVIRAPDLAREASRLTRRRQCPASDVAVQEQSTPSHSPLGTAVPTLSLKSQSMHEEPQPHVREGNTGSPDLSAQSRRHTPQAPPRLRRNKHPKAKSQPIYTNETLDHEGLVRHTQEFSISGQGYDTQTIINCLQLAQAQQAPRLGSSRRPSSIIMLPSNTIKVGGGWSQNIIHPLPPSSSGRKRASDQSDYGSSSKRRHLSKFVEDTTAQLETLDEPTSGNSARSRIAAERIIQACGNASIGVSQPARPPQRGTVAPPPSRQSTPPTVIELVSSGASSRSPSIGLPVHSPSPSPSVIEVLPEDPFPVSAIPTRGPTHARLRQTLVNRYPEYKTVEVIQATTTDPEADQGLVELPEPSLGRSSGPPRGVSPSARAVPRAAGPQRTYARTCRSHLPSPTIISSQGAAGCTTEDSENADAMDALIDLMRPEPESQKLAASRNVRKEPLRTMVLATRQEPSQLLLTNYHRRPLVAAPTMPPETRTQPRPPPGGNATATGRRASGSRRLDPVSAAQADMLAFSKAVAQGKATSLIESVRRENEGAARCEPPASRPSDGLLEDDEEELGQAESYAKSKWPANCSLRRSRNRVYKQKPLARDFSGLTRQVLVMAKVHLFAYSLVQGIYQTRATFFQWASAVHHATWQMELPDRPYESPLETIFEIMVNNIATLRGKIKERLREFVASVCGFEQSVTDRDIIQQNLDTFNKIHPNTFHCKHHILLPQTSTIEYVHLIQPEIWAMG